MLKHWCWVWGDKVKISELHEQLKGREYMIIHLDKETRRKLEEYRKTLENQANIVTIKKQHI